MTTRELRIVADQRVVGEVSDDPPGFRLGADYLFGAERRTHGDAEAARRLVRDGWSNGYLYLADAP